MVLGPLTLLNDNPQTHPKPPNGNDFDRKGEDGCRRVVFPLFQAEYFDISVAHHKSKPVFGDFSAFSASNPSCFTNKRRIHKIAVQYTCSASGDGPAADALGFVLDFLIESYKILSKRKLP